MKNKYLIILMFSILFSCNYSNKESKIQNISTIEYITFLDGGKMDKNKFICGCMASYIKGSYNFQIFNDNGEEWCKRMINKVSKNFSYTDIEQNMINSKDPNTTFWEKEKVSQIGIDVISEIPEKYFHKSNLAENLKTIFNNYLTETEILELKAMVKYNNFCTCYANELLETYSIQEIYSSDNNLITADSLFIKCAIKNINY